MEFNQSFLAPSISKPKLSKRIISSSVLKSGGSVAKALSTQKPELKTSTFNFLREKKPKQDVIKTSQLSADTELISSSLVETNRILIEIQKQLSLDFANRIAEQKNLLKTAKLQKEKQSRARKEFSLEKFGGVAKKITGLFAPITKPVKSIFDKLKEFLGIILSGVILEKAFEWLSKEENREKLSNIFGFLTKNWKLLAGLFIGTKVIGGLIKIVSFVRRIKKALGFLGKGLGRRGGDRNKGNVRFGGMASGSNAGLNYGRNTDPKTGRPLRSSGSISRYNESMARSLQGKANLGDKARLKFRDTMSKNAFKRANQGVQTIGKNLMQTMGMGPGAKGLSKLLRPFFKRIPIFGPLIDFAVSLALGESLGRAAAKSIGAGLGAALGTLIPIPGVGTILGGVVGDLLGGSVYDMLVKSKEEEPPKMAKGGMIGGKPHSQGGTLIEAERGEYIIDKINTQRYLPVLTSIKYQGGSSWDAFTNAIKLQENVIEEQFKTENKFAEFLDTLKSFYDEKYRELLLTKANTGTGRDGSFGIGTYGDGMPSNPPLRSVTSEAEIRDKKNYGNTVPAGSFGITPSVSPVSETQRRRNARRSTSSTSVTTVPMSTRNLERNTKQGKNGGMSFIELPPVVMSGGFNSLQIPTFNPRENSLTLPEIPSFDYSNDYLNIAISYYNIEGIKFGGE